MIKILDCTLRDGSHINKGLFDESDIEMILLALEHSLVDYVEVGFLEPGHSEKALTYFDNISNIDGIIEKYGNSSQSYGVLLRTDLCSIDLIEPSKLINFFRIAMYPEHINDVIRYANRLKECDYDVSINPIGVSNLSFNQINELITLCNEIEVNTFSIVDTNGALGIKKFKQIFEMAHHGLNNDIAIGLHLHENLNQSQSLVYAALNYEINDRDIIVDASINGMGRVPGNLPLELLMQQLCELELKKLDPRCIYSAATTLRRKYFKKNPWGYQINYAESARLNINRSYPEYFEKFNLPVTKIINLLHKVSKSDHAARFNKSFAKNLIDDDK
tara:strand:- start:3097 stop:4092 length:996 start_codon:yes stop_codon:yes gene_type:complete